MCAAFFARGQLQFCEILSISIFLVYKSCNSHRLAAGLPAAAPTGCFGCTYFCVTATKGVVKPLPQIFVREQHIVILYLNW